VLLSGQPQTDVTIPPAEVHGRVKTEDVSDAVVNMAYDSEISEVVACKLVGTAYSCDVVSG